MAGTGGAGGEPPGGKGVHPPGGIGCEGSQPLTGMGGEAGHALAGAGGRGAADGASAARKASIGTKPTKGASEHGAVAMARALVSGVHLLEASVG